MPRIVDKPIQSDSPAQSRWRLSVKVTLESYESTAAEQHIEFETETFGALRKSRYSYVFGTSMLRNDPFAQTTKRFGV